MTKVQDTAQSWQARLAHAAWVPLLLIRLFLGYMFLQTGWGKVKDLDAMAERFTEWGIVWPHFNAALSSYTELIGGGLIMLGLFTRLSALPLAFNMVVATLAVQMKDVSSIGDFVTLDEPLYVLVFMLLFFTGPGLASLDHLFRIERAPSERRPVAPWRHAPRVPGAPRHA